LPRAAILISRSDPSSMLVGRCLVEEFGMEPSKVCGLDILHGRGITAVLFDRHHLTLTEEEIRGLRVELAVVASSHRSESGVKSLTTHSTGNWTWDSSMGGLPRTLSMTLAGAIRRAYDALCEGVERSGSLRDWRVTLEATHHGPYSPIPLIYVEFGGPPEPGPSLEAARIVAEACIEACFAEPSTSAALGIGGGHYAPTFTRLMSSSRYDFGHILPKYSIPEGIDLLGQAVERIVDGCNFAVIDWKGVPGQYRGLVAARLKELGVEVVRE